MEFQAFIPVLLATLSGIVSIVGAILAWGSRAVWNCVSLLKDILVKVEVIEREVGRIDGIETFMQESKRDREGLRLKVDDHQRRIDGQDLRLSELEKSAKAK